MSATLRTPTEVSFELRILDLTNLLPIVYSIMPPSTSYAALIDQNNVLERGLQSHKNNWPAVHTAYSELRPPCCLEKHTMLVAGIDNILEPNDGIDEEAVGARLALSLEIYYATR